MPTYEEIFKLAQNLSYSDRVRLSEELGVPVSSVQVEGSDEVIPANEVAESQAALDNYRKGLDTGISSSALKQKLFGNALE
jgi:hypothetical protein